MQGLDKAQMNYDRQLPVEGVSENGKTQEQEELEKFDELMSGRYNPFEITGENFLEALAETEIGEIRPAMIHAIEGRYEDAFRHLAVIVQDYCIDKAWGAVKKDPLWEIGKK